MSGDYGFDANGNWLGAGGSQINTWNVENQLIATGGSPSNGDPTYTYDPWGKRVLQYSETHTYGPGGTLYFYSITGQRLGTYQVSYVSANDPPLQQSVSMYFGGRLLAAVDRLGSVRNNANGHGPIAYYPWGEERTTTPDGTDKFATYFRDSNVGGVARTTPTLGTTTTTSAASGVWTRLATPIRAIRKRGTSTRTRATTQSISLTPLAGFARPQILPTFA